HRTSISTLSAWLQAHGVPAIAGVDTRRLTRHLRTQGTIDGQLLLDANEATEATEAGEGDTTWASASSAAAEERPVPPHAVDLSRVLDLVTSLRITYLGTGPHRILLVDTGTKENIVRCLQTSGATVIRVPWNHPWEAELDQVDGLVLTNGPGDPM